MKILILNECMSQFRAVNKGIQTSSHLARARRALENRLESAREKNASVRKGSRRAERPSSEFLSGPCRAEILGIRSSISRVLRLILKTKFF